MTDAPDPSAGTAIRRLAQGAKSDGIQDLLERLEPAVARWTDDFVFGEVWGRPGLSHEERMMVAITSLASQGHSDQLSNYLWGAVQSGISPVKIRESILMLVVYAGFPPAMQALRLWDSIERKAIDQGLITSGDRGSK